MTTQAKAGVFRPKQQAHICCIPNTPLLHALLAVKEPEGWLAAMDEETYAHSTNNTWNLSLRRLIKTLWVPSVSFVSSISLMVLLIATKLIWLPNYTLSNQTLISQAPLVPLLWRQQFALSSIAISRISAFTPVGCQECIPQPLPSGRGLYRATIRIC